MRKLLWLILLLPLAANAQILDSLQEIREAAQAQIRFDPAKSDSMLIPDSVWNEFVNRACYRVAYDGAVVFKQDKMNLSKNTVAYIVDSAILGVRYVILWRDNELMPIKQWHPPFIEDKFGITSLITSNVSSKPGPPAFWYYNDSIYFWPVPIRTDSVIVGYNIYPKYLSADTMNTNIPVEYREAIVWYTVGLACIRLERYDGMKTAFELYNAEISKYIAKEQPKFDVVRQE